MNNNIIYRKGTVEDIPAFLTFFKISLPILFPEYSPNSVNCIVEYDFGPKQLTKKLNSGDNKVYLAFNNEEIMGYLFIEKTIFGVSYAHWLGVDKQYQKQGIASQLLTLWEQDAYLEGAHALHLWTSEKIVEFYEKCGFSYGGLFPKAWYGEDSYLIYKILRKPEEKNFLKDYLQQIKRDY